jgi:hypothetical protein
VPQLITGVYLQLRGSTEPESLTAYEGDDDKAQLDGETGHSIAGRYQ